MDKINDYIKVQNLISKDDCKEFISILNTKSWEKHTWHNKNKDKFHSEETKELDVYYGDSQLGNKIKKPVFDAIENYCNEFMNGPQNIKEITEVRWNKYSTGTMMRPHYDHIHSIFDGTKRGIPILSIVGVLNDDYDGGDFLFGLTGNHRVELKTGDILVFPSNFLYPHAVMEIKNGIRYSFVSWAF